MEFKGIFTIIVLSCRWMPRRWGRKVAARLTTGSLRTLQRVTLKSREQVTDPTHAQHPLISLERGTTNPLKNIHVPSRMWLCTLRPKPSAMRLNSCKRTLPKMHTKICCHTAYFKIPNTRQLPYKLFKYGCFPVKHTKLPVQQRTNYNTCQWSVPNLLSKNKIKNAQKITVTIGENTDSSVSTARSMHLSDL